MKISDFVSTLVRNMQENPFDDIFLVNIYEAFKIYSNFS